MTDDREVTTDDREVCGEIKTDPRLEGTFGPCILEPPHRGTMHRDARGSHWTDDAGPVDWKSIAEARGAEIEQLRAELDEAMQAAERRCSCDGDPIECSHEAGLGHAQAELARLTARYNAANAMARVGQRHLARLLEVKTRVRELLPLLAGNIAVSASHPESGEGVLEAYRRLIAVLGRPAEPPKCGRCRDLGQVPNWANVDEYGEPKPKPCPDCTPDLSEGGSGVPSPA